MCFRKTCMLVFVIATLLFAPPVFAQLSDLDLLGDDDRAIGISVTRAPDKMSGTDTESRSAILLLPVSLGTFQGGAGAYWTSTIANGENASALLWRVQGGPQFGKFGLQGYIEGEWKGSLDYAVFLRAGTFDVGRFHLSGGLGTLVRADTETDLSVGVERTAGGATDTKVKGLLLASADVDTELFDSLRLLGTVTPGLDGEVDYVGESQVSYRLDRINLTGLMRIGYEEGVVTKRWTGLVQVPF